MELEVDLPADEALWMAPTAGKWRAIQGNIKNRGADIGSSSLAELFALFAEDRLDNFGRKLNLMDMRLLLHPLHGLVSSYSQITTSLNARSKRSDNIRSSVKPAHSQTFDHIHSLCRRWHAVFETVEVEGARLTVVARATLVQYHLICINLLCSFPTFEMFARKGDSERFPEMADRIQEDLANNSPELLVHCGQILRHIRVTDVKLRPPWWSAAVYRAGLVLWGWSITNRLALGSRHPPSSIDSQPLIALDAMLGLFDPTISRYLLTGRGIPHLTAVVDDGSVIRMTDPKAVLKVCIEAFGRGPRLWRFTRGMQCKMETLLRDWDDVHSQIQSPQPGA